MNHHEFGLALNAFCDCVLEQGAPPVTTTIVDQIQLLHAAMKMNDSCVEQLRKKIVASR
jgi:hypothetical protein